VQSAVGQIPLLASPRGNGGFQRLSQTHSLYDVWHVLVIHEEVGFPSRINASGMIMLADLWRVRSAMGVWQGVTTDSLKSQPGPPCPTLLRSAGGPSPKCSSSTPLYTPKYTGLQSEVCQILEKNLITEYFNF
jgi:hypothetical protein